MTLHFFNDVTNDAESTRKNDHYYVIFASLKSESLSHWYPESGVVLDCIDS